MKHGSFVLILTALLGLSAAPAGADNLVVGAVEDTAMIIPKALLGASFGADTGAREAGPAGAVFLGAVGFVAGALYGVGDLVVGAVDNTVHGRLLPGQ